MLMSFFSTKPVSNIYCGPSVYAVITRAGELYTWGKKSYNGCLGHGHNDVVSKPTQVTALKGHKVTQIAFSMKDTHVLVVTDAGMCW